MTPCSGSASRLGLKALYTLSLLALCIYVVMGPAAAVTINSTINSPAIVSATTFTSVTLGSAAVDSGYVRIIDPYSVAIENVSITCDPSNASACSASVYFMFAGEWYPSPFTLWAHLTGASTDPAAHGTVSIYGGPSAAWGVANGQLALGDLAINITPSGFNGFWSVNGSFNVDSLAPGGTISWGATSLDFNETPPAVPEPGSALLLIGGVAWLEFLRRKLRK